MVDYINSRIVVTISEQIILRQYRTGREEIVKLNMNIQTILLCYDSIH